MENKIRLADSSVFWLANLMNIIMVFIFISRVTGWSQLEYILGLTWIIFILILSAVVWVNIKAKRRISLVVIPLLVIVFLLIELLLDYILQIDFRSTALLWPYLLLYYAALMGLIGYSFMISKRHGFITLITYFLNQIATFYSYVNVGHS